MTDEHNMTYQTLELAPGAMVFRADESADVMYLIQEGSVETLQQGNDAQRIAVLVRGDFFGEMAVLDRATRSYSARVLETARLVVIDASRFHHLLQRSPEIAVRMLRKLSHQLEKSEKSLARALGKSSGTHRVADAASGRARFVDRETGLQFILSDEEEQSVGRADPANGVFPDIDLTDLDPRYSVSRRHARIYRMGGDILVAEEEATNGTFINQERIPPDLRCKLVEGDEVSFGVTRLHFLVE